MNFINSVPHLFRWGFLFDIRIFIFYKIKSKKIIMKKIVRLTESDLVKLVKRVIKEQANPINPIANLGAFGSAGTKANPSAGQRTGIPQKTTNVATGQRTGIPQKTTNVATGQRTTAIPAGVEGKHYMKSPIPVRFYYDEANTKPLIKNAEVRIEKEEKRGNVIFIFITNDPTKPYFEYNCGNSIKTFVDKKLVYNKNYIADLKKRYCTTSAGGTPVTNIGRYSQVGNQGPLNIA
jgi:hypothetical protein